MSESKTIAGPLTGQCLCGAVKVAARNVNPEYHACHCGMCRRWNGGPSMAISAQEAVFEGEDSITAYDSSEWAQRAFCKHCGTNLYYHLKPTGEKYLWSGLFDDQSQFKMAGEIYIDHKPAGYAFAGDHPRMTEDEFLKSIGMK
ncbi:GFA family protein [Hahella sp. KA22]|uniref:GFA family protein n=1 Tax=Hahella sp. KA22 TaxID=1628392 RepID=UPI000FDEBEA2|nr:GFA family protein [Hahella sp. KA22]AZZ91056.1 GFA family protein [Hahella sp. KA22]QAY54426.1 GFA family protein [Hahella sp. KA22]